MSTATDITGRRGIEHQVSILSEEETTNEEEVIEEASAKSPPTRDQAGVGMVGGWQLWAAVSLVSLLIGSLSGGIIADLVVDSADLSSDDPDPSVNTVSYTLRAFMTGYVGVGGDIDGVSNPTLDVAVGDEVTLTMIMGEDGFHDLSVEGYNVATEYLTDADQTDSLTFIADEEGTYAYFCSVAGHRALGMEGALVVGDGQGAALGWGPIGPALPVDVVDIARQPFDVPAEISRTTPATVTWSLSAREVTAELEPGVTFTYWTYNATVPGPMLRAQVNDTVIIEFTNDASSVHHHNVDFHAVTGQGGGAAALVTAPGETTSFSFRALHAGLFVYHCATPDIPTHISKGMYGMILIEPDPNDITLPPVDREIYLMQGDIYTKWLPGPSGGGHQEFDDNRLYEEAPTYVVFNGKFNAFTGDNVINASVNETVRIYFGVGGPNTISSFHLIGEIFDRAWADGALGSDPNVGVQTILVPPGGAGVVDVVFDVPADYILVDHALTRTFHKGALGIIHVTGPEDLSIFNENG